MLSPQARKKFRSRILAHLDAMATTLPEAAGLRLRLLPIHAKNRNCMRIHCAEKLLVVYASDYLQPRFKTEKCDLAEDLLHELGHVAWYRERRAAGHRRDHSEVKPVLRESEAGHVLLESVYVIDELGAEIIANERAPLVGIAYGVHGGHRKACIDDFAWDVAGGCWYARCIAEKQGEPWPSTTA